jgi:hypothetical protein
LSRGRSTPAIRATLFVSLVFLFGYNVELGSTKRAMPNLRLSNPGAVCVLG